MKKETRERQIFTGAIVVLMAATGYLGYSFWQERNNTAGLSARVGELEQILAERNESLEEKNAESEQLQDALEAERARVGSLADEVQNIAGTVGVLEKLSQTDPELLQKYSKVYFLNEHYIPPRLTQIPEEYVWNDASLQQVHGSVWPHLEDLLEEAAEDEINLQIISAYRSFGEQSSLKAGYKVVYGSGANTFSADQGYSEHQLGTAVDFTTPSVGGTFTNFENTEAYSWLLENAHRFGFVLSYPPNNTYYVFEPWHWRYVGEDLAEELHDEGKYFYDLDQREIDKYLVNIFD